MRAADVLERCLLKAKTGGFLGVKFTDDTIDMAIYELSDRLSTNALNWTCPLRD